MPTQVIKPYRGKILVEQCVYAGSEVINGSEERVKGGIIIPEVIADDSRWAIILDVAKDCKYVLDNHIGLYIYLPFWSRFMVRIGKSNRYIIKEQLLYDSAHSKSGSISLCLFSK